MFLKVNATRIKKVLKNGNDKTKVKEIMQFVKDNNGIDYALKVAKKYSDQAKDSLNIFPDSQTKIAMQALVDFVTERKN